MLHFIMTASGWTIAVQGNRGQLTKNSEEMLRQFTARDPDLVLLDFRLERENGFDLLRDVRSRSDVPIIIMTGNRRGEIDRVVGFELGADDYVTKPFGLRELLALMPRWDKEIGQPLLDMRTAMLADPLDDAFQDRYPGFRFTKKYDQALSKVA